MVFAPLNSVVFFGVSKWKSRLNYQFKDCQIFKNGPVLLTGFKIVIFRKTESYLPAYGRAQLVRAFDSPYSYWD